TRAHHRRPLRRGGGLTFLRRQEDTEEELNALPKLQGRTKNGSREIESGAGPALRSFTPARYARLRERAQRGTPLKRQPKREGSKCSYRHEKEHIRALERSDCRPGLLSVKIFAAFADFPERRIYSART